MERVAPSLNRGVMQKQSGASEQQHNSLLPSCTELSVVGPLVITPS